MSNSSSRPSFQPVMSHTSTMAIISLVAGIGTWTILPAIAAIVAIITGHMAKNEIKKSGGTVTGNGMATAGLVLGYIQIAVFACLCVVVIVMLALGISIPFIGNSGTTY